MNFSTKLCLAIIYACIFVANNVSCKENQNEGSTSTTDSNAITQSITKCCGENYVVSKLDNKLYCYKMATENISPNLNSVKFEISSSAFDEARFKFNTAAPGKMCRDLYFDRKHSKLGRATVVESGEEQNMIVEKLEEINYKLKMCCQDKVPFNVQTKKCSKESKVVGNRLGELFENAELSYKMEYDVDLKCLDVEDHEIVDTDIYFFENAIRIRISESEEFTIDFIYPNNHYCLNRIQKPQNQFVLRVCKDDYCNDKKTCINKCQSKTNGKINALTDSTDKFLVNNKRAVLVPKEVETPEWLKKSNPYMNFERALKCKELKEINGTYELLANNDLQLIKDKLILAPDAYCLEEKNNSFVVLTCKTFWDKHKYTIILAGTILGILLIFLLCCICCICKCKRKCRNRRNKKKRKYTENDDHEMKPVDEK